jgi:hypothetical protein
VYCDAGVSLTRERARRGTVLPFTIILYPNTP